MNFHIELSTRCNGKCLSCWTKPSIVYDIDFEILKSFLNQDVLKNTGYLYFCGSHGDPAFHPKFFEILEYFNLRNNDIRISTNGSMYNPKWWANFASVSKNSEVLFSLDGTDEDTHRRYRGTSFTKTLENISAYSSAGGKSVWQFLVFKHNEHQVSEAKKLAEDMGAGFRLMISRIYERGLERPSQQFLEAEPSCNFSERTDKQKITAPRGSDMCSYINGEIYIGADNIAVPCHYYSTLDQRVSDLTYYRGDTGFKMLCEIYQNLDKLDISKNNLEDIINCDYFKNFNKNMWESPVCKTLCGLKCSKEEQC